MHLKEFLETVPVLEPRNVTVVLASGPHGSAELKLAEPAELPGIRVFRVSRIWASAMKEQPLA
jgi:hypothetical protein